MKSLFYPYLLAQYPDPNRFSEILDLTMEYADAIEIGIPFTDPVADGPVIASAASQVLSSGFFIDSLFQVLENKKTRIPIALMSYANPILAYGLAEFLQACSDCGAKYLIVPDIPFEESSDWRIAAKEFGLSWISFVSLSTGEERLQKIVSSAEGFIYLLSLKGITGSIIHHPEQIRKKALRIKELTSVPVALGFGIKNAEDTRPYQGVIDAFIVGSRIIEIAGSKTLKELENFYKDFRSLQ